MNTLQELNNFGSTTIEFADGRDPTVIFDRTTPTNQDVVIATNVLHTMPAGIEILDVINYSSAACSLTVNVGTASGATVSWTTVPSGCTVTNPSTGVYNISGINSKAIWDIVKVPRILGPTGIANDFWQYSATITYNTTQTKVWYVGVYVGTITVLSTPTASTYTSGTLTALTGEPQISYPGTAPIWTVVITPEFASIIDLMSSTGTGGTTSFNSTTKVLTITGTKTQVNSQLSNINITTTANYHWSYNLTYVATNNTDVATATKTQALTSTDVSILDATRASETYSINTLTKISNGPLITDTGYTGANPYSMVVSSTDSSAVATLSTVLDESIITVASTDTDSVTNYGRLVALSGDNSYKAIASDKHIFIYFGATNNYLVATFNPTSTSILSMKFNSDGSRLVACDSSNVYVFVRLYNQWTLNYTYSGSNFYDVAISGDGNTVVVGYPTNPFILKSSQNYATVTGLSGFGYPSLKVAISSDGNYIAATDGGSSRLAIWVLSSGTYSIQYTYQYPTSPNIFSFGKSLCFYGTTNTNLLIGASYGLGVFNWSRDGTSWSQFSNIPAPSDEGTNFADSISNLAGITAISSRSVTGVKKVYTYSGTTLLQTFTPSDSPSTFGGSVAIATTGSSASPLVSSTNRAYSYTTITTEKILTKPDLTDQSGDHFGYSTSLSGDGNYLAVGAPTKDSLSSSYAGAVYIFLKTDNVWALQTRLFATTPEYNAYFGNSVSMNSDGTYLAIGANLDDNSNGESTGNVYVYTRTGTSWSLQSTLVGSDSVANDYFGFSVSLNSDATYLAVGAPLFDSNGYDGGEVYIFKRTGTSWTEQTRFWPSTVAAFDRFGWSVSIDASGAILAVGAYLDDNSGGTNAGSAYIYTRSGTTWTERTRIQASDAAANDDFAWSVSLSGNGTYLAVSAFQDDNSAGTNAGSVYIFTGSGATWTQQTRLQASDGVANDWYGSTVSLSYMGDVLAVGAQFNDSISADTGAVYTYFRTGTTWANETKFIPSNGAAADYFGYCASLDSGGSTLVVGAYLKNKTTATEAGSAYVYSLSDKLSVWDNTAKTLTITASKNFVNSTVDKIKLTPNTGYDKNFSLVYTATTPTATIASRNQRVTRT
jgi:hypothetical protein